MRSTVGLTWRIVDRTEVEDAPKYRYTSGIDLVQCVAQLSGLFLGGSPRPLGFGARRPQESDSTRSLANAMCSETTDHIV